MNGWLVIDKPLGISSADCLNKIKRTLPRGIKIGHAGTLDPLASGLLLAAIGEATKLIDLAMSERKGYIFEITWGESRSTCDAEGEVTLTSDIRPTKEQIEAALGSFIGGYMQSPPAYSAIKIDGKRAYDLARKGQSVDIPARFVDLHEAKILQYSQNTCRIQILCGKGFYVRSLAVDIAGKLGTCGYVSVLRRTELGKFVESDAISLDNFLNLMHNDDHLSWQKYIRPILSVLDDILVRNVSDIVATSLRQGRKIAETSDPDGTLYIAVNNGQPVAICEVKSGFLTSKRGFNLI